MATETRPAAVQLSQLRHFLLVVEHGSYRLAADRACRTPSALSRSIQELEARLGAPLFDPQRRSMLSAFGRTCLPIMRDVIEHADRAIDTMSRLATSEHGMLSVGGVSTAAIRFLPTIISLFRETMPRIELCLYDDNSSKLQQMVKSGELDCALCSPPGDHPRLRFTPLISDAFGFVCSPEHRYAGRSQLHWDELSHEPMIRTTVHDQLIGTPGESYIARPCMRVSNMISLWAIMRQRTGVTLLPRLSVPPDEPGVIFVPLTAPTLQRTMGLLTLEGQGTNPALQLFESLTLRYFDTLKLSSVGHDTASCGLP